MRGLVSAAQEPGCSLAPNTHLRLGELAAAILGRLCAATGAAQATLRAKGSVNLLLEAPWGSGSGSGASVSDASVANGRSGRLGALMNA